MDAVSLTAGQRGALGGLGADLRRVFGARLLSLAAYGLDAPAPASRLIYTLALVDRLSFEDLVRCAPLAADWRRRSLAVPLILERDEFLRTLDVFPLEYGDIIASHVVVAGSDPFATARVIPADVRRACELSAKSHLIHLREAFMESGADPQAVGRLIAASAPAFSTLLRNIARLADDDDSDLAATAERQIGIPASVVREVMGAGAGTQSTIAEPTVLLSRYIAAAERVWEYVDTWRARA
jgi:bifunctional DNA-binding transcriptional regulator/antitoxin component of YhaV-PrlF toxin-antitoxin module